MNLARGNCHSPAGVWVLHAPNAVPGERSGQICRKYAKIRNTGHLLARRKWNGSPSNAAFLSWPKCALM